VVAAPRRDFAVTLLDGRRVVGRYHDDAGERSAHVYPRDTNGSILGSGTAGTLACRPVGRLVPAAYRPSRARGGRASAGGDRRFPIGRRERAQGRRVRGRSLKGATAMPHPSSGSPSSASRTPRFERPAWDAALRPAQRRAGLGRARREQRRLADARRQRLITVWLRELANH